MFNNFVPYKNLIFLANVQDSNWSGTIKILGQFFLLILIVIGILFATYYFVKMTSSVKMPSRAGKNMEVIETLSISYQNYIQIIKVCDEYFLIAVNKDDVKFLTRLENPEFEFDDTEHTNKILNSFDKYLNDFKNRNKDKDKNKDN